MKTIPLTQGQVAIVDDEDFEVLSQYKWYARRRKETFYAVRNLPTVNGVRMHVKMHRVITGAPTGVEVDHIDGNGLLNTRSNLRLATKSQNGANRVRISKANTSGRRGVTWLQRDQCWLAQIGHNHKVIRLGRFKDLDEAARAYDAAATRFFGEFARPNFTEAS